MDTKILYIVRHAKAEDYYSATNDYDRKLVEKGISRAQQIAYLIKDEQSLKESTAFISSSASRAVATAEIFADILGYDPSNIKQTKRIYEAHYRDILQEINYINQDIDTLFVFGHNPGLSNLISYLTDENIYLKTSNVAKITLEEGIQFSELTSGIATLKYVFTDK